MNIASSTITLIENLNFPDIISNGLGAFLGALFAFCFFVLNKWIERKYEWKKICKNEHAYLERYFYELKNTITDNKNLLKLIKDGYSGEKIKIMFDKLSILPIREDSSMKVNDKLFINKLETYTNNGIKKVNRLQEGLTQMQDALNSEITGNSPMSNRLHNNITEFIEGSDFLIKLYNYYIDVVENLIIENRLLLRKYKKWEFDKIKMEKLYTERSEDIEKEKISSEENYFNPLLKEQEDRLKKFGLKDEKIDKS